MLILKMKYVNTFVFCVSLSLLIEICDKKWNGIFVFDFPCKDLCCVHGNRVHQKCRFSMSCYKIYTRICVESTSKQQRKTLRQYIKNVEIVWTLDFPTIQLRMNTTTSMTKQENVTHMIVMIYCIFISIVEWAGSQFRFCIRFCLRCS